MNSDSVIRLENTLSDDALYELQASLAMQVLGTAAMTNEALAESFNKAGHWQAIARGAYAIADEMKAERERRREQREA